MHAAEKQIAPDSHLCRSEAIYTRWAILGLNLYAGQIVIRPLTCGNAAFVQVRGVIHSP